MYILWSHGSNELNFPMEISTNDSRRRAKRDVLSHKHSDEYDRNDGMIMAQLLRADKLDIPEKLVKSNVGIWAWWSILYHSQAFERDRCYIKRRDGAIERNYLLVSHTKIRRFPS